MQKDGSHYKGRIHCARPDRGMAGGRAGCLQKGFPTQAEVHPKVLAACTASDDQQLPTYDIPENIRNFVVHHLLLLDEARCAFEHRQNYRVDGEDLSRPAQPRDNLGVLRRYSPEYPSETIDRRCDKEPLGIASAVHGDDISSWSRSL